MRFELSTRHRCVLILTGDDARDEDEDQVDAVAGSGGSGDLTTAPHRHLTETEPDARRRTGFTT